MLKHSQVRFLWVINMFSTCFNCKKKRVKTRISARANIKAILYNETVIIIHFVDHLFNTSFYIINEEVIRK